MNLNEMDSETDSDTMVDNEENMPLEHYHKCLCCMEGELVSPAHPSLSTSEIILMIDFR